MSSNSSTSHVGSLLGQESDDESLHASSSSSTKLDESDTPIIKHDYFERLRREKSDSKPREGDYDRIATNSCSYDKFPTWSLASGTTADIENIGSSKDGPTVEIEHVRNQIKQTRAEIAKLGDMMLKIRDLRKALTDPDPENSAGLGSKLAALSLKDFEEFQSYLMEAQAPENSIVTKDSVVPKDKKIPIGIPLNTELG